MKAQGSIKMVLTLTLIIAIITLLSANYTEWLDKNNINIGDFKECRPVKSNVTSGIGTTSEIIVDMDCGEAEAGNIFWFNFLVIVPFVGALGYALVPFVK